MLVTRKDREEDKIEQEKQLPFNKYTTLHDVDRYIYDAKPSIKTSSHIIKV